MAIGLSTGESFEDMFDATYMPPQSNMSIGTRSDTERALIDDEQYASLHQDTAATPLTPMPSRALKADIETRRDVSEQDTGQLGGGNFVPGRYFAGDLPARDVTQGEAYARGESMATPVQQDHPRTDWPTMDDVEMSKRYELDYGDSIARYTNPGLANMNVIPIEKVPRWYNEKFTDPKNPPYTQRDIDKGASEYIHRAWLASRRSAVSQLGFDWGHTVVSPSNTRYTAALPDSVGYSELRGFYEPPTKNPNDPEALPLGDTIWANSRYETTVIHESVHRGLRKLQDQGIIPKLSGDDDEALTQLFIHRHFRSSEVEEGAHPVKEGRERDYAEGIRAAIKQVEKSGFNLDEIEEKAANYIAKKRPMGPR